MLNKFKKVFNIFMIMISLVCCVTMFTACKKKKSKGSGGIETPGGDVTPQPPAIVAVALTSDMITLEYESVEFNRTNREPSVTIMNGEIEIPAEAYVVSYSNNKNIGTATVLVEAAEGSLYLTGSASKTFEITIANLLAINDLSYALYDGESHAPNNLTLIDGLIYGTDYDVSWEYKENGADDADYVELDTSVNNFVEIGYYRVTATGKGCYTGTQTAVFGIYQELPEVQEIDPVNYTKGTKQVPIVSFEDELVNLELGVDYEISYEFMRFGDMEFSPINAEDEKSFIDAGEYKVIVSGLGLYGGEKTVSYFINSADLPSAKLTPVANLVYNEDPRSKTPVYCGIEGLTEGTDYLISWKYKEFGSETFTNYVLSPNKYDRFKNAGTYKAVFVGKNNYEGQVEAEFTVERANFVATLSKEDYTYNGESGRIQLTNNYGGAVTYYITTDGSIIDKLNNAGWVEYEDGEVIDAGEYFIHAKIAGNQNYNESVTAVSTFEVFKDELNGIPDLSSFVFYYNGESQLPDIEITSVLCSDPTKFVEGRDYVLEWRKNNVPYVVGEDSFIDPGFYSVTLYAIGNYEITDQGTYTNTSFDILSLTLDNFFISRADYVYGGEKSQIVVTHGDGENGVKTLNATIVYECRLDGTDTWFEFDENTELEVGKYYIRARASLRGYNTKDDVNYGSRSFNVLQPENN